MVLIVSSKLLVTFIYSDTRSNRVKPGLTVLIPEVALVVYFFNNRDPPGATKMPASFGDSPSFSGIIRLHH